MPVNVVKNDDDERHWKKAKALAARQGRAKDWPYIMGIFQKMTGKSMSPVTGPEKLNKSTSPALGSAPKFYMTRWPGQVPDRDAIEALRLAKQEPPKWSVARMMAHDGAYLTPANVVDGIGLDEAKKQEWVGQLKKASSSTNELTFRQEIMGKMLHDRMDPATRQALFQRAMGYYRDMRKSMVNVVTPDDLRKSDRPVQALQPEPAPSLDRLEKAIVRRVRRGPAMGLPLYKLDDLVRRYGTRAVADILEKACRDRDGLRYQNGVLKAR